MSSYSEARKKIAEQIPVENERRNYRCAAQGCPNAGAIDDHGEGTGKCYWHYTADPKDWPAVTERITANFERMRNWR